MRATPDEVKAQVIAALIAGASVPEISRQYRLGERTVWRIRSEIADQLADIGREKSDEIGGVLLSHLKLQLESLNYLSGQAADVTWRKKQTGDSLAALYGKIADHSIRLLEAASAVAGSESADSGV